VAQDRCAAPPRGPVVRLGLPVGTPRGDATAFAVRRGEIYSVTRLVQRRRVGEVHSTPQVRVRRAYDEPSASDGTRVLVDRLWPRGLTRQSAALDGWCKEVAPSAALRTWFDHDPERFDEFDRRYRDELRGPLHAEAAGRLRELATDHTLTLITATKAVEISAAAVLAAVLRDSL